MPHRRRRRLAYWRRPAFSKVAVRSSSFALGLILWLLYIYSSGYSPMDRRSSSSLAASKAPTTATHDHGGGGMSSSRRGHSVDDDDGRSRILRRPTVPTFEGPAPDCAAARDPAGCTPTDCATRDFGDVDVGRSGPFVVLNNLIPRRRPFAYGESITLTTHATYELLDNLAFLSRRWQGPISVAVYAPGADDLSVSVEYALWLARCHAGVADYVAFHFVLPADPTDERLKPSAKPTTAKPPDDRNGSSMAAAEQSWPSADGTTTTARAPYGGSAVGRPTSATVATRRGGRSTERTVAARNATADCRRDFDYMSVLSRVAACRRPCNGTFPLPESFRVRRGLPYPINVCRNVARRNAGTHFVLASDIELYPSAHVIPWFLEYCRAAGVPTGSSPAAKVSVPPRRIYVLPIFEVDGRVRETPATKAALVDLYRYKRAVYFHKHVCSFCNIIPKLNQWLLAASAASPQKRLGTFLVVKRHRPFNRWEPIYIGTNDDPLYEESLTWEGQQDKMTQMYELCLMNYDLAILDNAFLVHRPGIKRKNATEYMVKSAYIHQNNRIYRETVGRLEKKHGVNQWCK